MRFATSETDELKKMPQKGKKPPMFKQFYGTTVFACALALISGCASSDVEEVELSKAEPTYRQGSFGQIVLVQESQRSNRDAERSHQLETSEASGSALLTARAQFARFTSLTPEQARALVAFTPQVPRERPAPGQCATYDANPVNEIASSLHPEALAAIELLNGGTLVFDLNETQLILNSRHFAGLLPFITGVVYGESQPIAKELPTTIRTTLEGSDEFSASQFSVALPSIPWIETINDKTTGRFNTFELENHEGLVIRWRNTVEDQDQDTRVETFITLRYTTTAGRAEEIVCSVDRNEIPKEPPGLFELSADALQSISNSAILEIASVSRGEFVAPSLEQGSVQTSAIDRIQLRFNQN